MTGTRVTRNTIFLYLRMAVVMVVNLFTVRIVFKALGASDYGIYNVVAGCVTMLSSVTSVLSTATQRFYSFNIGIKNTDSLIDVFSASLNIYIGFSILVLLISESIGIWFVNSCLNISPERLVAANWVFQFAIFTFIATLLQAPFYSAVIAHEDMEIFALISFSEVLMKLLASIIVLKSGADHLVLYGVSLFLISIIGFVAYICVGVSKYKECHYRVTKDRLLYKSIVSFSGWHLFSSLASVGVNQVNTILVNLFFGPIVNAARSIALQINAAMTSFSGSFIMAIRPPMIKAYAEKDFDTLNGLFNIGNKIVFSLMLLIVLPLMVEMETVLKLWLNVTDDSTILFSRLILIYALVLSLNNPISIIVQASGRVKEYFVPVEMFTILCPIATYILFKMGYPAQSAFYTMIVAIVLSHVARLVCLKRIYTQFNVKSYLLCFVLPSFVVLFLCFFIAWFCKLYLRLNSVIVILISVLSVAVLSFFVVFTKLDRNKILNLIRSKYRA